MELIGSTHSQRVEAISSAIRGLRPHDRAGRRALLDVFLICVRAERPGSEFPVAGLLRALLEASETDGPGRARGNGPK